MQKTAMLAYVQFHCGVVKRDFVKTQREKKLSTMEKIDSAKLCKFFKKKVLFREEK